MNDGVTTYRPGERDLRVLHGDVGEQSQKGRRMHRGISERAHSDGERIGIWHRRDLVRGRVARVAASPSCAGRPLFAALTVKLRNARVRGSLWYPSCRSAKKLRESTDAEQDTDPRKGYFRRRVHLDRSCQYLFKVHIYDTHQAHTPFENVRKRCGVRVPESIHSISVRLSDGSRALA